MILTISILLGILLAVIAGIIFHKETPASIEKKVDDLIKKANTMKYKTINCKVTGISYRGKEARKALREAEEEAFVKLYHEPENKYDSSAVKVVLDDVHIGYIPREDSYTVSQALKYLYYAKIIDNTSIEGEPFVMIEIVFHAPLGLTDEEFTYVSTHAPKRLKELKDPEFGADW